MIVQLIIYALSGQVTCEIIYAVQEVIGQSSNSVNHQSSLPFPLNFVPRLSSNCFIETTPLPSLWSVGVNQNSALTKIASQSHNYYNRTEIWILTSTPHHPSFMGASGVLPWEAIIARCQLTARLHCQGHDASHPWAFSRQIASSSLKSNLFATLAYDQTEGDASLCFMGRMQ